MSIRPVSYLPFSRLFSKFQIEKYSLHFVTCYTQTNSNYQCKSRGYTLREKLFNVKRHFYLTRKFCHA